MRERLKAMYLDWVNNFLTVPVFAEHYGISEKLAELIIDEGRELHNSDVELQNELEK